MKKLLLALLVLLCGCQSAPTETVSTTQSNLGFGGLSEPLVLDRVPFAYQAHGVAGDGLLIFQAQPTSVPSLAKGVHVLLPFLGIIAELPPPPIGWGVPLSVKLESSSAHAGTVSGQFLVVDDQVPPELAGTAPTLIYRYRYSFSARTGFSASLVETHTLPLFTAFPLGSAPPNGIFYAGSIGLLPGGQVAIADNITGAIWFSDATLDNWFLGVIDPTPPPGNKFAATFGPEVSGVGRTQGGGFHSYNFLPPAPPGSPPGLGLYPGSHSVTYAAITDEVCWIVALPGGLYCMARSDLLAPVNPTTKPFRNIVPGGLTSIGSLGTGCDYDRFHPTSEWLYWAPSADTAATDFINTLYRVSLLTGEIQTVAKNNDVFDWTSELSVIPTPGQSEATALLTALGQQYNNPDVNVLLGGVASFVSPNVVPLVVVKQ